MNCYNIKGKPIGTSEWAILLSKEDYKRVRLDVIDDVRVSTVWLGLDHGFSGGKPLIFETMIFGGDEDDYQERYSTEEEAILGHEEALKLVKKMIK